MVRFLVLHVKKEVQAGGGESDGVEQQRIQRRGVGSSRLEGVRRSDHFCLALAETHDGLTPVTHPGDGADKS